MHSLETPKKPHVVKHNLSPTRMMKQGEDPFKDDPRKQAVDWTELEKFGIQPHGREGIQVYCRPDNIKQIRALAETLLSVVDHWRPLK